MIEGLDEVDYLAWNYDFFRIHRVIPPVGSQKRADFKLKDLQVADLNNNPGFGRSILATLLVRMYDALWIEIGSPKSLLVNPGDKTMGDLAAHCNRTAKEKHPAGLGSGDQQ
jgi:hypothetical protein